MATAQFCLVRRVQARSRRIPWPSPLEWLIFAIQVLIIGAIQVGDDVFRGNIFPPSAGEAIEHGRDVAAFEAQHGFFMEPALQIFFHRAHDVFGLMINWPQVVDFTDAVYAFGHLGVTVAVAAWVFARHRERFGRLRNIALITGILALIGYELYPLAPPRLTTGLDFDGQPFAFVDPMRHVLGTGKLNGSPIGYNPFSAMPSLHVAWALITGACLVILSRHLLIKIVGVLYPTVMTFTVLVTANHYLMDAAGAAAIVTLSAFLAVAGETVARRISERLEPVAVEVERTRDPAA